MDLYPNGIFADELESLFNDFPFMNDFDVKSPCLFNDLTINNGTCGDAFKHQAVEYTRSNSVSIADMRSCSISPNSSDAGVEIVSNRFVEDQSFASCSVTQPCNQQVSNSCTNAKQVTNFSKILSVNFPTPQQISPSHKQLFCFIPIRQSASLPTNDAKETVLRKLTNNHRTSVNAVGADTEIRKRMENRRFRNRISAQQSRMRKRNKEYEMNAQLQRKDVLISDLATENAALKHANEELLRKIGILESENEVLRSRKAPTRATFLSTLAILFCVTFYVFKPQPYQSTESYVSDEAVDAYGAGHYFNGRSRVVLSIDDSVTSDKLRSGSNASLQKRSGIYRGNNLSADCIHATNQYPNKTEALRLNNDIRAWVDRHSTLSFLMTEKIFRVPARTFRQRTNDPFVPSHGRKAEPKKHKRSRYDKMEDSRLKAARERSWRHIDMISSLIERQNKDHENLNKKYGNKLSSSISNRVDRFVPLSIEAKYMELLKSFKQQDDTLYFLAMKDYFLVPPINRNSIVLPRFTLILPAFSYNGTIPNQISMIRLDCEVTKTGLFNIQESIASAFYYNPC